MNKLQIRKQTNHIVYDVDGNIIIKCLLREDLINGLEFYCPFCKIMHKHSQGPKQCLSVCESPILAQKEYLIFADPNDVRNNLKLNRWLK